MTAELGFVHELIPAGDGASLTLLLLHGTGGDERDLLPLGQMLADDATLLSPRGKVTENGMPRWFRRHAEGVFDIEDLTARAHELADFVVAACERYDLDRSRLVATGFSNGANIAGAMLLLRPEVCRAAMLFAPMVPLRDTEPVDLSDTAVFLGAGRADPICPPEDAEELAALLTERGAAVELHWHPDGHQLVTETVTAAKAWLGKLRMAISTDPLP